MNIELYSCDIDGRKVTISFESSDLYETVGEFQSFLKAIGYDFERLKLVEKGEEE